MLSILIFVIIYVKHTNKILNSYRNIGENLNQVHRILNPKQYQKTQLLKVREQKKQKKKVLF